MTEKQRRFVSEYLINLNATQAAIRAGYSEKCAAEQGYDNLRKPQIAAAIAEGQAKRFEKAELSADRVLEEMRRIALADPLAYWDEDGDLKPIKELTAEQAAALAGFEVVIKNAKAGDNQTDTVHKIKFWDKVRMLEQLGKHFGLIVEKVDVNVQGLGTRLDEAREAARQRNATNKLPPAV